MKNKPSTKKKAGNGIQSVVGRRSVQLKNLQGWIPVKKRKPKGYDQIIVAWDDEGELRPIAAVYRDGKFLNLEEWHRPQVDKKDLEIGNEVYWMPLPKPPRA